jgi:bacteriocin-like protein
MNEQKKREETLEHTQNQESPELSELSTDDLENVSGGSPDLEPPYR